MGSLLNNLSQVLQKQVGCKAVLLQLELIANQEKLDQAETYAREAVTRSKESRGPFDQSVGVCLHNLSLLLLDQVGRYPTKVNKE